MCGCLQLALQPVDDVLLLHLHSLLQAHLVTVQLVHVGSKVRHLALQVAALALQSELLIIQLVHLKGQVGWGGGGGGAGERGVQLCVQQRAARHTGWISDVSNASCRHIRSGTGQRSGFKYRSDSVACCCSRQHRQGDGRVMVASCYQGPS